jgi:hypothetical protein
MLRLERNMHVHIWLVCWLVVSASIKQPGLTHSVTCDEYTAAIVPHSTSPGGQLTLLQQTRYIYFVNVKIQNL